MGAIFFPQGMAAGVLGSAWVKLPLIYSVPFKKGHAIAFTRRRFGNNIYFLFQSPLPIKVKAAENENERNGQQHRF